MSFGRRGVTPGAGARPGAGRPVGAVGPSVEEMRRRIAAAEGRDGYDASPAMAEPDRAPPSAPPPSRAAGRGAPFVPEDKSVMTAALLAFTLGMFAAHRFYVGRTTSALVWLGLVLVPGVPFLAMLRHVCMTSDCVAAGAQQAFMQVTSVSFFVGLGAVAVWCLVDTVRLTIAMLRHSFAR